jgi:hypothetical protein
MNVLKLDSPAVLLFFEISSNSKDFFLISSNIFLFSKIFLENNSLFIFQKYE